jgi:putative oxidoreductase
MDANRLYWPETLGLVRIVIALLFLEHGSAKLVGFIHDLVVASGHDRIGRWGAARYRSFLRPVAFILSGNMAVAYFMAHAAKSFFPLLNGGDETVFYCFIFLLFFVAGPGRWSVDAKVRESSSKVYDAGRDQFPHRTASAGR